MKAELLGILRRVTRRAPEALQRILAIKDRAERRHETWRYRARLLLTDVTRAHAFPQAARLYAQMQRDQARAPGGAALSGYRASKLQYLRWHSLLEDDTREFQAVLEALDSYPVDRALCGDLVRRAGSVARDYRLAMGAEIAWLPKLFKALGAHALDAPTLTIVEVLARVGESAAEPDSTLRLVPDTPKEFELEF